MAARLIAIGDLHGASSCLDHLMTALQLDTSDALIFLGDYIDRGPDSKGVIDRLLRIRQRYETICLLGNHELMLIRARTDAAAKKLWLSVGGVQALASYGPMIGRMGSMDDIPNSHWQFLEEECVDWLEIEDFIFAHAGVDPARPMQEQTEAPLFWDFINPAEPIYHYTGKTVICGHTSQKSGLILDLGSCICIDTYAYGGKYLTALDVFTGNYWQVNTMGKLRTGQLRADET